MEIRNHRSSAMGPKLLHLGYQLLVENTVLNDPQSAAER